MQTVRINELPVFSTYGTLSLADRIPVWLSGTNKTVYALLSDVRNLIETGGGITHAPVYLGGNILYVVPDADNGLTAASIPSLAGKDFLLSLEGRPLIPQDPITPNPNAEYEILDAGGFQLLTPGDVLQTGQRYLLDVFSLQAGAPVSSGGSFITGSKTVSANTTLNTDTDLGKLIQIRGVGNTVTLTIPSVDDVPENTIIPIETAINNTKEHKILTTGGQYIYMNNTGYGSGVYMRAGETLWLYRGDDGWYVINDSFAKTYSEIGRKPESVFAAGLNELVCKGQLLLRADYPRLWAAVQTLGFSVVTDAVWSTASATTTSGQVVDRPYRGCFSHGDGTTTFRLPDLMNMSLRGLNAETGTDAERFYNKAGGFQKNQVGPHAHQVYGQDNDAGPTGNASNEVSNVQNPTDPTAHFSRLTSTSPGNETRMDNVGILWVIKA